MKSGEQQDRFLAIALKILYNSRKEKSAAIMRGTMGIRQRNCETQAGGCL